MALTTGTKLGPYEVLSPLGAGGMGEVYKARDSRLDRIVAIKVLLGQTADNGELRQRFEREARAVSSLNHPNICTLYDVGAENGIDYLVMEYLEGTTLSARLTRGPLATDELLRIAVQIADALDKAHRQGLIHRDLKPANVMLTKSGAKLLDFGLAKLTQTSGAVQGQADMTRTSGMTGKGTILGTLQYMSPEQLEGNEADARSDIFAFGAMLYEMTTGKRAFEGKSQASLIAAILEREPTPISDIQPMSPPAVERIVKTCLSKDPDERFQSAHDLKLQLKWLSDGNFDLKTPSEKDRSFTSNKPPMMILAAVLVFGLAYTVSQLVMKTEDSATAKEIRFVIPEEPNAKYIRSSTPDFALSPDGSKIAMSMQDSLGVSYIALRQLSSNRMIRIQGTEGGEGPFWSPDGSFIGFERSNPARISKVSLAGGSPQDIYESLDGGFGGVVWLEDGTIIFESGRRPIMRISADGGTPEPILDIETVHEKNGHSWPILLPDKKHYIYRVPPDAEGNRSIYLAKFGSKEGKKLLANEYNAGFLPPDYLLFMRGSSLMAQRIELDPPSLIGNAVLVADNISINPMPGTAAIAAGENGTLLYRQGGSQPITQLVWFDRKGNRLGNADAPNTDVGVSLSHDNQRAAVCRLNSRYSHEAGEQPVSLWTIDLKKNISTRITADIKNSDESPIWSTDDKRLLYASHKDGSPARIAEHLASGSGNEITLLTHEDLSLLLPNGNPHPSDWSADGQSILFQITDSTGSLDLAIMKYDDIASIKVIAGGRSFQSQGQFSPDGEWIVYSSNQSERPEIYIRPLTGTSELSQISSNGGLNPRWRRDGKAINYLDLNANLMEVTINPLSPSEFSSPVMLFNTGIAIKTYGFYGGGAEYDVTTDGSRFLVNTVIRPAVLAPLNVVLNWKPPDGKER